ncbi:uncharacterized protein EI97DRAFT_52997 [Westerdykella ornata]|uniref:Uncharacterized protein n=1 Tax=Westerdykella ornata TaxID=318751 RepID=A0A6A6JII2_WESOR|nr:uncharacterized protein EI97DRAFT_52997 [Westerdykella ornata]KAF2276232.1 hypothetical protein EI97DRAFT_52997 [Westerdykella ornata]
MHFETSPSTSPAKSLPIAIRPMASPTSSLHSNWSQDIAVTGQGSTCAYPSWPTGKSLGFRSPPSSYISDADLFGEGDDDCEGPFLDEAPAPPRVPPMAQAFPILPPLYVAEKPKKQQRRRSSGRKSRRSSKPMSPIAESVEVVE